jgi:hypothetical protein
LQDLTLENELVTVTSYILAKQGVFTNMNIPFDIYTNFMTVIQKGYKNVTYHNKTHAADLSQTFNYFCTTCHMREKTKLDDLDFFTLITAGACHDHEHPGFNNVFLVESKDPIAIRYNDVSVLENHHVASSFQLMLEPNCNVFASFGKDEYKRARSLMISAILGTDMSKHFAELGKFKSRLADPEFNPAAQDKDLTLTMMFHLADISNATKPWETCQKWTDLLFVEFFH